MSGIPISKGHHTSPSFSKDLETIMRELRQEQIFVIKNGRDLPKFTKPPLLKTLQWKNIQEWVKNKIIEFDFK